ncbi:uncharacterized protein METZ01_LOCUS468662, partial [marine metagenome]
MILKLSWSCMAEFQYKCSNCEKIALKWEGKCSGCEAWGTFEEIHVSQNVRFKFDSNKELQTVELSRIDDKEDFRYQFFSNELNMVFGGGLLPGSVTLIAGEPGVG